MLLVALAATRESKLVYTLGVGPAAPSWTSKPGKQVCQGPITPPSDAFDRVVISLGTYFKPGPPVEVVVRDAATSRALARGKLAGGYPDIADAPEHAVAIPSTSLRRAADVCIRNTGRRRVAVYGAPGISHRTSTAIVDGKPAGGTDLAVRLDRDHPRSLLSRLPTCSRTPRRSRRSWSAPWTFWVLLGIVLLGVPALLARAIAGALRDDDAL